MLFGWLSALQGDRVNHFADQKTRALIKTNYRIFRVERQSIKPKDLLHSCEELTCHLTDAPLLFQMRLEFVFFRMAATFVCETCSTILSSTALSANRRNDQRA